MGEDQQYRMRVVMGSRSTPPAATASSETSSRVLDIKKESPDDEIKVGTFQTFNCECIPELSEV